MELSPQLARKFETLQNSYPAKRSALIPMLMYAQDEHGFVSDEMIEEIARRLDLNTVQVTETLVYYSMLRRKPLGKYHVQICTNVSCMLQGGYGLLEHAKRRLEIGHKEVTQDGVFSLEEVECLGACTGAPCMQVNYDYFENLTTEAFDRIIEYLDLGRNPEPVQVISGALHPRHPAETPLISRLWGIRDSHKIDVYLQHEGYAGLKKAVTEMTPNAVIEEVKKSNLRGRGGAGFPTGMKWSFVPKDSPKPKYVICNADESEPGTCKDRPLMEMDPHQLIEGIIIAGRAINAHQGFIYIRGEYRYVLNIVERAIEEAYSRGYPRIKPPFPAIVGLYGCPTIINNVETLSAVPAIIREGGEAYANRGTRKNGGTRLVCVSGNISKPGIYEVPRGFNMKCFIEEVAGGVPDGRKLKAVIPGGSSCPLLKADEIDIPMDYDSVAKAGSMLGSGGMVIVDEDVCMVDLARRIMQFYAHESCGWCIPCREGTAWLRKMLERFHAGAGRPEDIPLMGELAKNMLGKTFCPLGDAAAMPTISIVEKWRHEFEEHLHGRCAYRSAEALVRSR